MVPETLTQEQFDALERAEGALPYGASGVYAVTDVRMIEDTGYLVGLFADAEAMVENVVDLEDIDGSGRDEEEVRVEVLEEAARRVAAALYYVAIGEAP